MSPRRKRRLEPAAFNLPVDLIKAGFYTDTYFVRSREILRAESRSPRVVMQVTGKHGGYLSGIDESIVEKVAIEAGQHPHGVLFELDQGDLPLFLFLCAGIVGGFILGYCFRMIFAEKLGEAPRARTSRVR